MQIVTTSTFVAHHHTHGGAACGHAHVQTSSPSRPWLGLRMFRRGGPKRPNGLVNGDYSLKDLPSMEADVGSRTK